MEHITLQVVQHLQPGGIEKLVLNLARFASPCHQVYIVALEGNKETAIMQWPELRTFESQLFFLNKPTGMNISTVIKLKKLIAKLNVTMLHSHHIGPLLYSRLALLGHNATHIHTEHDSWHLADKKQCRMTRYLLKTNRVKLIADAPRVAYQLEKILLLRPDHVICNGIDTQFFTPGNQLIARKQFNLPLDKKLIGCAGRLVKEKGIDTLIRALHDLPKDHHLVIAGDGHQSLQLRAEAQKWLVTDRIHWLGYCAQMRNFYRAIDVFCMPSRQEGLPLALLEAQSCGNSIVATTVGAIPDLICPQTGILVPPDDETALTKALIQVLEQDQNAANQTVQFIQHQADVRAMTAAYEALSC
ncbi:MAG: glycosyltransferase [Photobacterium frigidiphilum]|uniref:glycosyltransferase n=1 Tax=Photobacterium frigidiphilum TaxID=264736 RepID=UPI0030011F1B